jgi:hypothetical protein
MLSHLLFKDSEAGKAQLQELIAQDLTNVRDVHLTDLNLEFLTLPKLKIFPTPDEEIANQNADL